MKTIVNTLYLIFKHIKKTNSNKSYIFTAADHTLAMNSSFTVARAIPGVIGVERTNELSVFCFRFRLAKYNNEQGGGCCYVNIKNAWVNEKAAATTKFSNSFSGCKSTSFGGMNSPALLFDMPNYNLASSGKKN